MGNIGSRRKELSLEGEEVNFDHFQVLRAIGKGSFGKVCIVQKQSTERLYAMKYMNKAQCEAKEAVANVLREIEILASLEHPFLVNLWFSFQDEEDMFMVVDLLLGGDLRYHVQQGVVFSDDAVRLYILEVASALDYLHKRNIIHRDIKPDNLLLDEEGHVHLTDFNIATVLKDGQLATSMSGTKPYMAPELFECAVDCCEGYRHPVDWWSLGVTAYEVRRGKRPFDIHSNTPLSEVRLMFLSPPRFPADWSLGLIHIITKLLTISPPSRITSLESLQRIPYAGEFSAEQINTKEVKPPFTPPKDHLNCDPTFELEEMIIESKPLHKKKKRLLKQKSIRESQPTPSSRNQNSESIFYQKMLIFNREREEVRKEKEKREREWQEELDRSMSLSDPTGQGSEFCGSKSSLKGKKKEEKKDEALDGVLSTLIAASALSFSASIGPFEGIDLQDKYKEVKCDETPVKKISREYDRNLFNLQVEQRLNLAKAKQNRLELDGGNYISEHKLETDIKTSDYFETCETNNIKLTSLSKDALHTGNGNGNGNSRNITRNKENKLRRSETQEEYVSKRSSWHQISETLQNTQSPFVEKNFQSNLKEITGSTCRNKFISVDSCKTTINKNDIAEEHLPSTSSSVDEILQVSPLVMPEVETSVSQSLLVTTSPSSSSFPSTSSSENIKLSSSPPKGTNVPTPSLSCLTLSSTALCSPIPTLSSSSSSTQFSKTTFPTPSSAPYFSSCFRSPPQLAPKRSFSLNMQTSDRHVEFLPKRSSDGIQILDKNVPITQIQYNDDSSSSASIKDNDEALNGGVASNKYVLMMSGSITPAYSSSMEYISSNSPISADPTVTPSLTETKGKSLDERMLSSTHSHLKDKPFCYVSNKGKMQCLPFDNKIKTDLDSYKYIYKEDIKDKNDPSTNLICSLNTSNECENRIIPAPRVINKTLSSHSLQQTESTKTTRKMYGRSISAESSNKKRTISGKF